MKVVIETPKYSFIKYKSEDGKVVREFTSPLPNLFNYGYIAGSKAEDGMEKDAIVLGKTLKPGDVVEVKQVGLAKVIDDAKVDDKHIMSSDGKVGFFDEALVKIFFTVYLPFKKIRYRLVEKRAADCRFLGYEKTA